MASKYCIDAALDAALNNIINNADFMYICTTDSEILGIPDYVATTTPLGTGTGAALIAGIPLVPGNFTIADGDVSGRKAIIDAFPSVLVDQTGGAQNVSLVNSTTSEVLYVATTTIQTVTAGANISIPAWSFELRDPS